jgi:predicted nucleic acid-binding protein
MPVERIENLPAGTRLFLDANIFVYAFLGHSNQCRELLGRCATEQVLGITSLEIKDLWKLAAVVVVVVNLLAGLLPVK